MKRFALPLIFFTFSLGFAVTAMLCVFHLFTGQTDPFSGPGTHVFKADAARSYLIMHREKGMDDGKFFEQDDDAVENARIEVVDVLSGAKLPLSASGFSSSSGSEKNKGLASFDTPRPGDYRITISDTPPARFLIQADDFIGYLLVSLVSLFGMFATGIATVISFLVALGKMTPAKPELGINPRHRGLE